ncbi:type 1 glutamine amidotransferase domain-containing protein [Paludifilum halophilum]|uniref:Thiamine biosynthesis protein ThiJ n=1 Tax=Paludifilum halophilum TaxID=1642702 RepID=A0A235B3R2_9BACL|nr:type 1 glutamine amidotransferase domain-containing protein [Paludifilum halophilum]OYD06872.1 thiamine biosynthesis protein ThiJ [Paludifilum halophilum]
MAKVLAVLSSGYKDEENNYETGWWGEELFAPMQLLEKAGHQVDLASPLGGKPKIDEVSISKEYDPEGTYRALYESGKTDETQKLSEVRPSEYDAIMVVGGHGAMYDLAKNEDLHRLINSIYDQKGIVAAVCHGPAPLLWTQRPNGENIIAGKKVTGYPDAWEPEGLLDILPFSLEQEMRKTAEYAPHMDEKEVVIWADDQIVTGRDPMSSERFGKELVKALQEK